MGDQLSLALNEGKRLPDLLIVPCGDAVQIRAIAHYYSQPSQIPTPHLLIWLLFEPNQFFADSNLSESDGIQEYRDAFTALRRAIGDDTKITVRCETAVMAATYRDIIELNVGIAPGPNLAGENRQGRRRNGGAPKIVTLGHANTVKGYHLLPDAISRVLGLDDSATFFIHGTLNNANDPAASAVFDALSKMGPRVATSNQFLAPSDYLSHLLEADLLLLPYDSRVYAVRGSGLFNEALKIGIPVVATRGCAFAQPSFDEGWGIQVSERSSEAIADALLSALKRLPALSARAEETARAYQVEDVGTLLSKIVGEIHPKDRSSRAAALKKTTMSRLETTKFFSGVHVRKETWVGANVHSQSFLWSMLARKTLTFSSLHKGKLITTSPEQYSYSILVNARQGRALELGEGSYVVAELWVEVTTGSLGVSWVDENAQILEGTERYAPARLGMQRVVVPVPADRVRQLLLRNFAAGSVRTSFRILELNIFEWPARQ